MFTTHEKNPQMSLGRKFKGNILASLIPIDTKGFRNNYLIMTKIKVDKGDILNVALINKSGV